MRYIELDPEERPTSDMTPKELVEAGEDDDAYITHNTDDEQVVVYPTRTG